MKNNNHYLFILFLAITPFVEGYSQQSVTVSGGNATGSGGSSSYSVGQITYTSQTSSGGNVTLGVQQPYEIVTLGKNDFAEINLVMSAYPNPTIDVLNLVVNGNELQNLSYQIFDSNGRTAANLQKITSPETQLSMQQLPKGVYFLTVNSDNKTVKTFKIIKK